MDSSAPELRHPQQFAADRNPGRNWHPVPDLIKYVRNHDESVVESFGREWSSFDQSGAKPAELTLIYNAYFAVFPWEELPARPCGFDLGCGSGRWAKLVATRVAELHCIDASEQALAVARKNLSGISNAKFHCASVEEIPLPDESMDFGYSLGVLHHVPDTAGGIASCVRKLKRGAPLLLYLYYSFDNRPVWFRVVWRATDLVRAVICRMPHFLKRFLCELIAVIVYWPVARLAWVGMKLGIRVSNWPLSAYRDKSFYIMRNDSLDRFGTRLEQRFSRVQIERLMTAAGLERIRFSEAEPFWCAVGYRK